MALIGALTRAAGSTRLVTQRHPALHTSGRRTDGYRSVMAIRRAGATAVVRARSGRLLRGIVAMVLFALPVVLLGFAVRQQFDPLIRADESASRAATGFTVRHGLVPLLKVIQVVSLPIFVYLA